MFDGKHFCFDVIVGTEVDQQMSSVYAMRFKSMVRTGLSAKAGINCKSEHHCRYRLLDKIGEGTYGTVFRAVDAYSGRVVAVKKMRKKVITESVIRNEIDLLSKIRHKNVVQITDEYETDDSSQRTGVTGAQPLSHHYLVLEFCDFDLHQILYEMQIEFSFSQIKNILQQILEGIAHIHECKVIHRDVKPENILVNRAGRVQIADFGFAQSLNHYSSSGFSSKVVTLAYRAPELLVGYRFYGTAIDMWSVGCIMYELWSRSGPVMVAADEYHQLIQISRLCGPINSNSLLGVNNMCFMSDLYLPQFYCRKTKQLFAIKCTEETNACDLFDRLLCLNINDRITAKSALSHSLFAEEPKPSDISEKLLDFEVRNAMAAES